jgi:hypothetical protein
MAFEELAVISAILIVGHLVEFVMFFDNDRH